MRIFIASDHAGVGPKATIAQQLRDWGDQVTDLGPATQDSVHYPDFATELVRAMAAAPQSQGILICTTGLGMSMVANKYQGIRAALCYSVQMAEMARRHNDANILCLAARTTSDEMATDIVRTWRETEFEGGRHAHRISLFSTLGSPPL